MIVATNTTKCYSMLNVFDIWVRSMRMMIFAISDQCDQWSLQFKRLMIVASKRLIIVAVDATQSLIIRSIHPMIIAVDAISDDGCNRCDRQLLWPKKKSMIVAVDAMDDSWYLRSIKSLIFAVIAIKGRCCGARRPCPLKFPRLNSQGLQKQLLNFQRIPRNCVSATWEFQEEQ